MLSGGRPGLGVLGVGRVVSSPEEGNLHKSHFDY